MYYLLSTKTTELEILLNLSQTLGRTEISPAKNSHNSKLSDE